MRERRRPELSLIPAYVDVLEERVLLSSFAIGTETLVNGTIPGDQKFSAQTDRSFTATPDGGALLAWTSTTPIAAGVSAQTTTSSTSQTSTNTSSQTIIARFVDAQGNPAGGEFQVSAGPCQLAGNAAVGVAGGGRYVIVWEATGDSLDKSGAGIFARIYTGDGTPVTNEFRVAQTTTGDQRAPSVVLISPTTFAVVWSGAGANRTTGVYARVFNNAGAAVTNEIRIPSTTKGTQQDATVMSLPGGGFIVAWSGNGTGDTAGVFARRFDAAGKAVGNEFLVNSSTAGTQTHPTIAVNYERGIVIAWEGSGCNLDGSGAGVFARRFSLTGVPQGNEFLVSDVTTGDQKDPSIVWLPTGGFAVTWSGNGIGDADGVFVREFENNGTARGPSKRVNTTTIGSQAFPTIRVRGKGYTIDWSGTGIGDSSGVFLQAFGTGDNILPTVTARLMNDTGSGSTDGVTKDPTVTGTAADNIGVTLLEAAFDLRNGAPVYRNITKKLLNGGYTLTSADLFGLLPTLQPLSVQTLPGLPDGAYTLFVRGRDAAGNTSPLATLVFTLDTTPPEPPSVDLPAESDSGESSTDNLTNLTSFTLTGGAESGALVKLTRNGQSAGQTTANSPWQIAQSGLVDGAYVYTATAQDVAGNVSGPSASLTVVIDTLISAPTAALQNDTGTSSSDQLTNDPTIQGTAADPNGIALLEAAVSRSIQPEFVGVAGLPDFHDITSKLVNGTFVLTASDVAALLGTALTDGDYKLNVRARDNAGNVSLDAILTFALDLTAPPLTLELGPDFDTDAAAGNSTIFSVVTLVGKTTPGGNVQLLQTGQRTTANAGGAYVFSDVFLVLGQNDFTVRTTDAAGNKAESAASIVRVDNGVGLFEANQFVVESEVLVPFRQVAGARTVSFAIEAHFDTTDPSAAVEDQFLVYLVDPSDTSHTLIDRGQPGTALFALHGTTSELIPGLVRFDGTRVEIDVTELTDFSGGILRFQLINSDADTQTRVAVTNIDSVGDPRSNAAAAIVPSVRRASPGGPLNLAGLAANSAIQLLVENVRFDTVSQRYVADLRLRNDGPPVGRQVVAVFNGLPEEVDLTNRSGLDSLDQPYINFATAIPAGGLQSGAFSDFIQVTFSNPDLLRFALRPTILVGSSNRPPVLAPIGPLSAGAENPPPWAL